MKQLIKAHKKKPQQELEDHLNYYEKNQDELTMEKQQCSIVNIELIPYKKGGKNMRSKPHTTNQTYNATK